MIVLTVNPPSYCVFARQGGEPRHILNENTNIQEEQPNIRMKTKKNNSTLLNNSRNM